ncbi:hypothetical protein [uncultured Tenacibaculum sp.]|uniref:toxin-antitoxin system YwqK family antitoxin n=1 Tax=uncultured Tenacibaculum sp. TaxID=174713 RepID=UPI002628646A|nr:hypothetical protein [uncultured Tenacibaculum sp.]
MKKIKRIVLSLVICNSLNLFSQKDSIVNYLDWKGKVVKKKNKASFIETVVKKDSLWLITRYYRNGKMYKKGYYKDEKKKNPIGSFLEYYRNGKLKASYSYNLKSKLNGIQKVWFYTGAINHIGFFKNGVEIGIWKYYHTNGKSACRRYFSAEGNLIKTKIYNLEGKEIKEALIEYRKPKFKGGGLDNFFKRIKELHNRIGFQINGEIYINFVVDENGKITNVNTNDNISLDLKRRLKSYFENIEGWEPAISMNRKIPYNFSIPFTFYTKFN